MTEDEKEQEYGKYKLQCDHKGEIIWKSDNGKTIGVRGTNKKCSICGVIKEKQPWNPTVWLINIGAE